MRIRILRSTICNGVPVEPGQVVDAEDTDAWILIQLKKALPYTDDDERIIEQPEIAVLKRGSRRGRGKHVESDHPTGA